MGNPVVHFEVVGRDARVLESFYKDAFDWRMEEAMPNPYYAMAHPAAVRAASTAASAKLWVTARVTSPSTLRSRTLRQR